MRWKDLQVAGVREEKMSGPSGGSIAEPTSDLAVQPL